MGFRAVKTIQCKSNIFCIGSNIEKYPGVFETILKNGHAIGNHTYNHLNGWKHKTKVYLDDIEETQVLLNTKNSNRKLAHKNNLFRPPYGKLKAKQALQLRRLGYKIVMWDVLSFDWKDSVTQKRCFDNIINSTKAGSIIVMHDSVKASKNLKAVLPKVLKYYSERGFTFEGIV